ncbi:MAG: response regulator, partial [Leptospira sp.]|nr:response regulator [Leptospira sp.]
DVNKQTELLTGCTRDELIGAPFKNYFTDSARAEAGINRVLNEGKITNYELTARSRDGRLTVVSYNATTFHDRDRSLQGVFTAARDVTELKLFEHTQRKNVELADASRMKSEFLANMSHELRTPLNNMMILSQLLFENVSGNLSTKQIEFARTINSSGNDLLQLINDILDLSKIESGKMSVEISEIHFGEIADHLNRTFTQVAKNKGIEFHITLGSDLPQVVFTDSQRLLQILRNLLSNAFKFTERGGVTLSIEIAESGWSKDHPELGKLSQALSFSVKDTGIGISNEKRALIFEAFQQADGSTSRKYGGTGLGLSISREIARILGGEISVKSELSEGSVFTFYLPETYTHVKSNIEAEWPVRETKVFGEENEKIRIKTSSVKPEPSDDRLNIQEGERVVLIVEDDIGFASLLLDTARENGFKGILAFNGDNALSFIEDYKISAIILDIKLPDMDGWSILDRLKRSVHFRHIPIQVISADDQWKKSRRLGAIKHSTKPIDSASLKEVFDKINRFIDRKVKMILLVDPDTEHREKVIQLLSDDDLETISVTNGADALKAVKDLNVDCVVLDIGLPDLSGFEVVSQLRKIGFRDLPIIVYTGFSDSTIRGKYATDLKKLAISNDVLEISNPETLLDETSVFLHRRTSHLIGPTGTENKLKSSVQDSFLDNRKILVVDDDIRNIFALTSVLEQHRMQVFYADNALDGIELLKKTPDMDAVLMDIMMPVMDGYSAMREIRKIKKFVDLPVIAVTAKAMREDRQKC